jgi:flagellar biogenesis protein FliO
MEESIMLIPLINLILMLGIVLGAMWFFKKKFGEGVFTQISKKGYIRVIDEGIQMGLNQKISLIKVGDEIFIHSSGPNGIDMHKLEQKELHDYRNDFDLEFEETLNENKMDTLIKDKISSLKGKLMKK